MIKKENKLITAANFQDFDWNKAKFFYHIVKCGSFLKAARLAGVDQSVLRRQIKALEEQVGCPLLVLKPAGIQMTRKGEELLENISPFFLKMRGFCGNNHVKIGGEKKRKIRISTSHALVAYVISDFIVAYNKYNDHLTFEIIGEDHTIDVILNDVDIAIRPHGINEIGVRQEPLFTLEKKLYASEGYLKEFGEPTTIEELENHRFLTFPNSVDYPYSDVNWVLKVGMPKGKIRKPFFTSNSIECLVEAAKNDMGIMSGYEQMKIFKNSGLKIILPTTKGEKTIEYFVYPDYLKEDYDIIELMHYLKSKLSPEFL